MPNFDLLFKAGEEGMSQVHVQSEINVKRACANSSTRYGEHGLGDGSHVPANGSLPAERGKLGTLATIVHLCKGNIGPGAMSLPYGFARTGTYLSPVFFILVASLCTYNMDLLLFCKSTVNNQIPMSFGQVGGEIFGKRGQVLINVFLVAMQLGICCVYFTFIATNLYAIIPERQVTLLVTLYLYLVSLSVFDYRIQEVIHERHLIIFIFPCILLLSWFRTLKRIIPFSGLANGAVAIGIIIVLYLSLTHTSIPAVSSRRANWAAIPDFYGTAVYSFEGIGIILPLQNEMEHPQRFRSLLLGCMFCILILFIFIGEIPAVAFGEISSGSITAVLQEYAKDAHGLVIAANVLLAFACLLSFPIQFFPAIQVLESSLSGTKHMQSRVSEHSNDDVEDTIEPEKHRLISSPQIVEKRNKMRGKSLKPFFRQSDLNHTLFRTMICLSLMIVAICVPNVGLLISLFGAVCSSMLAIILPPIMYLRLCRIKSISISVFSWLGHGLIVVFGIAGMLTGTLQAFKQIIASLTTDFKMVTAQNIA
uniref:Amino Acid/Auxin Permease (AAAP) Family putative n=1 Tax=Albugo laibachii Nc14 TaxID=890382 RepID=F0WEJ3_9STRA|nr:Amino Acid/Auxin Permease (AAAP) Family putative [Albugo laibachii Nc14]CCA22875.1 Amino Acid/Auxin Permease (AAAP) Family putative [Albugo laibachii Nc14]|eukprot:CCA22875.1 Amino Acid/Auxin Permease (AAAP) Family putative [Albugo laibachii Nc14]